MIRIFIGIRNFWRKFLGIDELERICKKTDLANEEGIIFLLNHVKINTKELFEPYRHKPFEDMPYYLRILFKNKYHLQTSYHYWVDANRYSLLIGDKRVGFNDSHLVEIYENIKKVDDELSDK